MSTSEIQSMITCQLCHKQVFEPKTLPCQHTFCHRCILGYCKRLNLLSGIQCPTCQKSFAQLGLTEISIDAKVLLLIQMAGTSQGEHESSLNRSVEHKPIKGILKTSKNGLPGLDDSDELINPRATSSGKLHSALNDFSDDSNSDFGSDVEAAADGILSSSDEDLHGGLSGIPEGSDSDDVDGNDVSLDDSFKRERANNPDMNRTVEMNIFDDHEIDPKFNKIFLHELKQVKSIDIQSKKDPEKSFIHDVSVTRDGNIFVVDLNNNVVKCCDSNGLTLKRTSHKLLNHPIRLCELYTGELLVVEMENGRGRLSALERNLMMKNTRHKNVFKKLGSVCVVRQMPEDKERFYCGDSHGYVHRVNLRDDRARARFYTGLPRVYHMAAANSMIAVNDGNCNGKSSKTVKVFDEEGNKLMAYSGTQSHPFVYHGDMVFHGEYLLICDFWDSKLHILYLPGETPAVVMDLRRDLGLRLPNSMFVTRDHRLIVAAQKDKSKKSLIFEIEYLA